MQHPELFALCSTSETVPRLRWADAVALRERFHCSECLWRKSQVVDPPVVELDVCIADEQVSLMALELFGAWIMSKALYLLLSEFDMRTIPVPLTSSPINADAMVAYLKRGPAVCCFATNCKWRKRCRECGRHLLGTMRNTERIVLEESILDAADVYLADDRDILVTASVRNAIVHAAIPNVICVPQRIARMVPSDETTLPT